VRVLPHPSKTGANRPGLIHRRLNVDADFAFRFRPLLLNPFEKIAQFFADYFVIIVAPGVTRYFTGCYVISIRGPPATAGGSDLIPRVDVVTDCMLMRSVVIQSNDDD